MAPVTIRIEDKNEEIVLELDEDEIQRARLDSEYLNGLVVQYYQHQEYQPAEQQSQNDAASASQDLEQPAESRVNDNETGLFIWNEAGILLLLSSYEEHKEDMSRKRHKVIYDDIAKKMKEMNPMYELSGGQCQSTINSLKKHYKKIKDHNNRSGNDRVTWPYYEKMEEIFGSTGWAQPVAVASNEGPFRPEVEPKKRKLDSILEKFFEDRNIYRKEKLAKQQENFEKFLNLKRQQHNEKIAILKDLCNLSQNNNNIH